MKRRVMTALAVAMVILGAFLWGACDLQGGEDGGKTPEVPEKYQGFHNYPAGRQDPAGILKIENSVNSKVLLFTSSVDPANYIGTVDALSSIKVKLPEEKFYTIVAVDKALWEERGDLADRFSDLTYYSRTLPYSMKVSPSNTYGGAQWIINNNTAYWVSFRKSDQSGTNYAVVPPNARRVIVPVKLDTSYDYFPRFYRELKYDGQVIALSEFDSSDDADTVRINSSQASKIFTTDIGNTEVPNANIKPAIFFSNQSDKTVRIYNGRNNQLSSGASGADDYAMPSGTKTLFSGFETLDNTKDINFEIPGKSGRTNVSQDTSMESNKVYEITLRGANDQGYSTEVNEVEASKYFQ